GDRVPLARYKRSAPSADRPVRMVVHLAAGDGRRFLVEEPHHVSDQPGLGLSALTKQDQVVAGEDATFQGREHRRIEPDDRGEQLLPQAQPGQKIGPELLLYGAVGIADGTKFTDGARAGHGVQPTGSAKKGDRGSERGAGRVNRSGPR